MNKFYLFSLLLAGGVTLTASAQTAGSSDDEGDAPLYFTHDFEDTSLYPTSGSSSEKSGSGPYGEWLYLNTSSSTNSSYLRTGMGARDLRVPKNKGAYVTLPVLDRGVKELTFWEGRGGRSITVYTSTDGGANWTKHSVVATDKSTYINKVTINDLKVNRIRLANEGSADADIDNIAVSILAAGKKATLTTGEATDITQTQATVSGTIVDLGDKELLEQGIVWSTSDERPTTASHLVKATGTTFSVTIDGLQAGQTVYYRAYAITGAGTAYGDVRQLQTAPATKPAVETLEMQVNPRSTDRTTMKGYAGGMLTTTGGEAPAELGVMYGTQPDVATNGTKALATSLSDENDFTVVLKLLPNTTYYYRTFATNSAGTAYGEEKQVTTGDLVISEFTGNIIYCSPKGNDATADGSEMAPYYSLQKAVDQVEAGDTIYMMAGRYVYDARVNIDVCGTEEKPIALFAQGGRAVLDFSGMPYHGHSDNPYQGVRLTGSYWHLFGLDITNASDNGLLIERNKPVGGSSADVANATEQAHDNIIEQCNFYKNGDTGLQMKNLASFNKVINCDAYLNCDEGQGDADGFAPKISVGDGNYFYGCRAWLNSDDGWDVFFKKSGGFADNVSIIMDHCITYKNGYLDENTIAAKGNGNGFKMGSDQGAMNVYLNRCLAVMNKAKGFDQNHNAGDIIMNNCTGMTLKSVSDKTYSYRIYEAIASGHVVSITNCIAINDNAATNKKDKNGNYKEGEDGKYGNYGRFQIDSSLSGLTITTSEFQAASPDNFLSVDNHAELVAEREADGSLPATTYAHLVEGSSLIDAGTPVGATTYRGIAVDGIDYYGTAPDLGAYESNYGGSVPDAITAIEREGKGVDVKTTRSGQLILTVKGAKVTDATTVEAFDLSGRLLGRHQFQGATTTISLPGAAPVVVLKVKGQGVADTIKVMR